MSRYQGVAVPTRPCQHPESQREQIGTLGSGQPVAEACGRCGALLGHTVIEGRLGGVQAEAILAAEGKRRRFLSGDDGNAIVGVVWATVITLAGVALIAIGATATHALRDPVEVVRVVTTPSPSPSPSPSPTPTPSPVPVPGPTVTVEVPVPGPTVTVTARATASTASRSETRASGHDRAILDGIGRRIATCESGDGQGSYSLTAKNSRSSASGKYQAIRSTWEWVMPDYPPPASRWPESVQDRFFLLLWDDGRGASHWAPSRSCWG